MKVSIIAKTMFLDEIAEDITGFEIDLAGSDAANLAEFAGRACYGSFGKPNPATRRNHDYLDHILDLEHYSVIEHGTVTFYVEEVSRSLTHELIRHRHESYSQLSQRYVTVNPAHSFITPPFFEDNVDAARILQTAWEAACAAYDELVTAGERRIVELGITDKTRSRKLVREAARAVLPNMTPTAIVVSGNHRSFREFLTKRGSLHADAEIRRLAVSMCHWLKQIEPNLYPDFVVASEDETKEEYVGLAG
jgi:thymidylate synthase (FAD)